MGAGIERRVMRLERRGGSQASQGWMKRNRGEKEEGNEGEEGVGETESS